MIHHVVASNPELVAVAVDDHDPVLRERWKELAGPRLTFAVANVCDLPFERSSFQIVTAFSTLEYIEDPHLALREIRRVCNGWLIASVPLQPWWRVGNIVRRRHMRSLGKTPGHVNHWSRRGFRKLLEPHGRIEYLRITPMWCLARVRLSDREE